MAVPFGIGKVIDIIFTQNDGTNVKERLKGIYAILMGIFVIGGIANFGRVYLMRISGVMIIPFLSSIFSPMNFRKRNHR